MRRLIAVCTAILFWASVCSEAQIVMTGSHRKIFPLQVATPTQTPDSGSYVGTQSITIATSTSGATLYYCTNSSADCSPVGGTTYSTPVSVASSEHLCSYGTHASMSNSAVKCSTYTISAPAFSPALVGVGGTCSPSGSSLSASYGSTATAGEVMIVSFGSATVSQSPTVADLAGTSYGSPKVSTSTSAGNRVWIWVGVTPAYGSTNTVTVTGAVYYGCIMVSRFSGLTGTVIGAATQSISAGTMAWSQSVSSAPSMIYASVQASHSTSTFTVGSGWTLVHGVSGADAMASERQTMSGTGTSAVSMTVSTADDNVGASVVLQ